MSRIYVHTYNLLLNHIQSPTHNFKKIKGVSFIKYFHLSVPFLAEPYLFWIPVWYIKCFWIVLWALYALWLWLWLKVLSQCAWDILLIFITISVLFFILCVFANGAVRSPSTFLYLWGYNGMGVIASWDCGSIFIGGFEVDVGGIEQSFLNLKRFPNIDPALGHWVPVWVGIFSSGGGCCLTSFLGIDFPFLNSLWY